MVSYSGGQLASLHFQHFLQDKPGYIQWLQTLLNEELTQEVQLSNVRVYHYAHAVGIWKPNFAGKKCMRECAVPHPVQLPNLYWVNENFSEGYQGWAEGSLEVADHVLSVIQKKTPTQTFTKVPKNCVVMDGRILNVEKWMEVHPGTKAAIWFYLGKDVSDMFHNIHTTKTGAIDLVLPLQIGFLTS